MPNRRALFWISILAPTLLGNDQCGDPAPPPACSEADEQVIRSLAQSPATDEDGSFARASNGRVYFAFISNRNGNMDTFLTSTTDGLTWTEARAAVATGSDDLMNSLTLTSDGTMHLTGRSQQASFDTTAQPGNVDSWLTQGVASPWSAPRQWSAPSFGFAAGLFQEELPSSAKPTGAYWHMFLSNDTGDWEIHLQESRDKGMTWLPAIIDVSNDPGANDYIFSFRITPDNRFIVAWEKYALDEQGNTPYFGASSEIYLATSNDGLTWTRQALTPDPGRQRIDALPWLHDGEQGEIALTWMTSAHGHLLDVVKVPVYPVLDLASTQLLPVPEGAYSVRSQRLGDGRYLLAWVTDVDPRSNVTNFDYQYRITCDFDFPPAP